MELNDTPRGNRIRISLFGLRNAGKSTLANALTAQPMSIVSPSPGTTTDPVSKAMEILPLGPCLITDTAGIDDVGDLGSLRVDRTLEVLAKSDVAIWVTDGAPPEGEWYERFVRECRRNAVSVIVFRRGDDVEALKGRIAASVSSNEAPPLLEGLVGSASEVYSVVCVCPIDGSAPKGRLILPQVQLIRECLDRHVRCTVCQPSELEEAIEPNALAVTDSQAFGEVRDVLRRCGDRSVSLTSFSILFARQKGDLAAYCEGIASIARMRDGDLVLVAEGCTHHRQCNDIGTVRIPAALRKMSGRDLRFEFASGGGFDIGGERRPDLIVHCGGCMLTRREVLRRIAMAKEAGIPIVNYGMVLAAASGIELERGTCRVRIWEDEHA